jgi:hypothetical protein
VGGAGEETAGFDAITPEPPEPKEEPGEPEREYPFWTYFIDNPCPNTRTGIH